MRYIVLFFTLFFNAACYARMLHFGDRSVPLNSTRNTSPALAVSIADEKWYGAMYSSAAPTGALRLRVGAKDYWVGKWCEPGQYLMNNSECVNCGMGHYCTGGLHRAVCTYGAIGCPEVNFSRNANAQPDGLGNVNKFMTLSAVEKFIPKSDISVWRRVKSCAKINQNINSSNIDDFSVDEMCMGGTIGPGTYLFVARYKGPGISDKPNLIDALDGRSASVSYAYMAVFDQPVGYAGILGNNIVQFFIDTAHEKYVSATTSYAPVGQWNTNTNNTNVTGLADEATYEGGDIILHLFELK